MTAATLSPDSKKSSLPVVAIIGCGFGGLSAARALKNAPVTVVLIDRTNHHLFQPLLYQVATAGLSPADIAKPVRSILRGQRNVTCVMAEITGIDVDSRELTSPQGNLTYDYLIVATGARHSYFGNPEWEKIAPGLKSLGDATEIRRRILTAFEEAEKIEDEARRKARMTFVVVGGGPTGVEMAGAISELARHTLSDDFRHIDPKHTRVVLVEATDRILATYTEDLSASAVEQLESLDVEVRLSDPVENLEPGTVTLKSGPIPCDTVIWAAGTEASGLARKIPVETDKPGRAKVNQDLTIPDHPEIQAVGDIITVKDKEGKPVPGVAPAAMQAGKHAAENILRQLDEKPPTDFWYFDKGNLATIGRHRGIGDLGFAKVTGTIAWLAWAFIHLFFLIGFRNRILVFFQWAYAYVTYARGARLIGPKAPGDREE
ncbi:MAG: NAD(P)/FAD-dependent oxidoreductase [Chthoniobacterales bacterium]